MNNKSLPKAVEDAFDPACTKCCEGWICEEHPDKPWPHDDCAGPGMLCSCCRYKVE